MEGYEKPRTIKVILTEGTQWLRFRAWKNLCLKWGICNHYNEEGLRTPLFKWCKESRAQSPFSCTLEEDYSPSSSFQRWNN
ncbi:hypothetical protein PVK06_025516 [Gossypium arboreum]|uniref:Uncharacterized protein n=1 Tax=Gossypium arboreum TaxID=29729 RepID=A0ABR0PHB8_GOSAR|nr:hypothetical protein PVK06_025516 [Gossypium arboreum]